MGLLDFFRGLFQGKGEGLGVDALALRLGLREEELRAVPPVYREFAIPKRSGGTRRILAPSDPLKALQRRILRRLLKRLSAHPAATGFERGQSIVTNARRHVGKAVVVRMDLKDFFGSTAAKRVRRYFQQIGWNREAGDLLTLLCTHQGGLPQGAPTSPRLANLVNHKLDARLTALAGYFGADYSRYADDLFFSWSVDHAHSVHQLIRAVRSVAAEEGYEVHRHKKLFIRRRHQRQLVTGLVVNERIALPRFLRRWLRAVGHHLDAGREATLTPAEWAGWQALQTMIEKQKNGFPGARGA